MSSSIQTRVLALVGAAVFVAGGLLSLLSRSSLLDLEQELLQEQQQLATTAAAGLAAVLDDELRLLASAATAPRVDLGDGHDEPEMAAVDLVRRHSRLWSEIAFLSAAGDVVVSGHTRAAPSESDPSTRALVVRAVTEQRPLVSDVLAADTGRPRAIWVVPFRGVGGRPAGALAGTIALPSRRLGDVLQPLTSTSTTRLELLDAAGRPIARAAVTHSQDDDTTRPTVVAPVNATPWVLRLTPLGPDPLAPIAVFRRRSLWLAPSLAGLATLLGWGIARSVRRPLVGLTVSAERIARGDLGHVVDGADWSAAGNEISRLATALESMRQALERYVRAIEQANAELEDRVADRTRQLAAMNARLEERERIRQQLLRTVISAQEDERKRVARELHDETSQTLAALGIGVDTALASGPPEPMRQRLGEVRQLVDRMHQELHRLIVNLRPSVLDDLGLGAAIGWFAERQLGKAGIAVRCETSDLDRRLPSEIETSVFRAVQEAIVNISRHARAESVLVQVGMRNGSLTVEIEDDGVGFEPALASGDHDSLRGIGLLGMRERIEILGGKVSIESDPGCGTRVVMEVPVSSEAAVAAQFGEVAHGKNPHSHRR